MNELTKMVFEDSLQHMTKEEKAAYNREYYRKHKEYWRKYYGYGTKDARDRSKEFSDDWRSMERKASLNWDLERMDPASYVNQKGSTNKAISEKNKTMDLASSEYRDYQSYQSKIMKKKLKEFMKSEAKVTVKMEAVIEYGKRKLDQLMGDIGWASTKALSKIKSLGSNPFS